ncbi:MAG: hypothetical protein V4472_25545 [Pseudomonadota bacterium]
MSVFRRRRRPSGPTEDSTPLLDRMDAAEAAQRRALDQVSSVFAEVRVELSKMAPEVLGEDRP